MRRLCATASRNARGSNGLGWRATRRWRAWRQGRRHWWRWCNGRRWGLRTSLLLSAVFAVWIIACPRIAIGGAQVNTIFLIVVSATMLLTTRETVDLLAGPFCAPALTRSPQRPQWPQQCHCHGQHRQGISWWPAHERRACCAAGLRHARGESSFVGRARRAACTPRLLNKQNWNPTSRALRLRNSTEFIRLRSSSPVYR